MILFSLIFAGIEPQRIEKQRKSLKRRGIQKCLKNIFNIIEWSQKTTVFWPSLFLKCHSKLKFHSLLKCSLNVIKIFPD